VGAAEGEAIMLEIAGGILLAIGALFVLRVLWVVFLLLFTNEVV
jgi:NhaP-type Na+/H+ or K+/H+ antiporter